MTEFIYTKNPLILLYAEIRYTVGLKVQKFIYPRGHLQTGVWKPLWHWSIGSESRYNCLIEPLLGKVVKWESKQERAGSRGVAAARAGQPKKAEKYFAKARQYEDRKDVYAKMRYPDHLSRLDRKAIDNEIMERILAKHEKKD